MMGNYHVRFLGGKGGVLLLLSYPVVANGKRRLQTPVWLSQIANYASFDDLIKFRGFSEVSVLAAAVGWNGVCLSYEKEFIITQVFLKNAIHLFLHKLLWA